MDIAASGADLPLHDERLECRVCGYTQTVSAGYKIIRRINPPCPLCGAELWNPEHLRMYREDRGDYASGGPYWSWRLGLLAELEKENAEKKRQSKER